MLNSECVDAGRLDDSAWVTNERPRNKTVLDNLSSYERTAASAEIEYYIRSVRSANDKTDRKCVFSSHDISMFSAPCLHFEAEDIDVRVPIICCGCLVPVNSVAFTDLHSQIAFSWIGSALQWPTNYVKANGVYPALVADPDIFRLNLAMWSSAVSCSTTVAFGADVLASSLC